MDSGQDAAETPFDRHDSAVEPATPPELIQEYGLEAFVAIRARFFLAYRLTGRFLQLAALDGGARTWPWRAALAGFVLVDFVQWSALRKPERFGLKTRLVIDSLDIAIWSLASYPNGGAYALAIIIGAPLALEAGIHRRLGGLVVPSVALAVTAAARTGFGRPIDPQPFFFLVVAVGWGVLLNGYIKRLQRRAEIEWTLSYSAEQRRAYLAGQNAVAMGANSVVDVIEGLMPILGQPEKGSVLWQFADAWKPTLYQTTKADAAYLGQVLAEWSAEHNAHPDLSSRVELNLDEGIGTILLTGEQEAALRELLSRAGLRGSVPVTLQDPTAPLRPPGAAIDLVVGASAVPITADPRHVPRRYDPGPAAFVIMTLLILSDAILSSVAPQGAVPGICLSLAAAWWAHRRLHRLGESAQPAIMSAAVFVSVAYTALATLSLKHPTYVTGTDDYPIQAGIDLLALLGGFYWDRLKTAHRLLAIVAVLVVAAVSWALHPAPNQPLELACDTVWFIPLFIGARGFARELDASSQCYARRLIEHHRQTEDDAFGRGKASVIDLVGRAREEAKQRLAAVQATLSPELSRYTLDRLEEVDRRLQNLELPDGPCSSTTTN